MNEEEFQIGDRVGYYRYDSYGMFKAIVIGVYKDLLWLKCLNDGDLNIIRSEKCKLLKRPDKHRLAIKRANKSKRLNERQERAYELRCGKRVSMSNDLGVHIDPDNSLVVDGLAKATISQIKDILRTGKV